MSGWLPENLSGSGTEARVPLASPATGWPSVWRWFPIESLPGDFRYDRRARGRRKRYRVHPMDPAKDPAPVEKSRVRRLPAPWRIAFNVQRSTAFGVRRSPFTGVSAYGVRRVGVLRRVNVRRVEGRLSRFYFWYCWAMACRAWPSLAKAVTAAETRASLS
jgi:hypothetical protein